MKQVKMSLAPALNAQKANNIKSQKLDANTTLTIENLIDNDAALSDDELRSGTRNVLVCAAKMPGGETKRIKVPVRDFMNMIVEGDSELYKSTDSDGEAQLIFPKAFTVKSSADRTDRDGNPVYPTWVYEGSEAFIAKVRAGENDESDYAALKASGFKAQFSNPDPVQDYTISVEH